jgi:AraC-like DNA-binding protein
MRADQYVELRVLPWTVSVEVLRARYTTFEFPTHAHAEFTIAEVLRGSERFVHLGTEVEARTGWLIHLNPSAAHNGRAGHAFWTYVAVYPGIEFLRWALPEVCMRGEPRFATPVSHRPTLRGRLAALVGRVFDGADDLHLQSELIDFLRVVIQPVSPGRARWIPGASGRSMAVARVRERLADEWDRNLSLIELATSEALSPLTLLRAFREEVGCTPYIYRTARRIAAARRFVREGTELAAVAVRCGFTDQSHFTNTFRRWTGLTPGQYRAFARQSRRSA